MYLSHWHETHQEKTVYSAHKILQILGRISPLTSVLDLGCGHGDWLNAALEKGANDILGCDGAWTDQSRLKIPRENFRVVDLCQTLRLNRDFSLAICLEAAEHIPEAFAGNIVDSLTGHGDMVFFGAAIPYQGGYRHVNEQWPSWWRELFRARGFLSFDPIRRIVWDDPRVHFWYKQNPLLYIRETRADLISRASEAAVAGAMPIDVVHPEKYESVASYREIALKPLIRALPRATLNKLHAVRGGA